MVTALRPCYPSISIPTTVPLGSSTPSVTTFKSGKITKFRLFAKSKVWLVPATDPNQAPKDLYSDLIGPTLYVDLDVEPWQAGEPDRDRDGIHTTEDIQWIDLTALGPDYAWNSIFFHDHAKWTVSRDLDTKKKLDWAI